MLPGTGTAGGTLVRLDENAARVTWRWGTRCASRGEKYISAVVATLMY